MFFSTIKALLASNKAVSILLSEGAGNNLSVTIIPTPKGDGKDAALATPLNLTATAEELDAEFPGLLNRFTAATRSLEEQMASTEAVLKAAAQASAGEAAKAISKAAAPAVKVPPTGCDDDDGDDAGSTAPATVAVPAEAGGVNIFA